MRKTLRMLSVLCLVLTSLTFNVVVGNSQSLAEEREEIIELFMTGFMENYSYEEVEDYIQKEEAYILETGNTRSLSSYGINNNHSTGHATTLLEYLYKYFAANTTESQLKEIYPYAVDFTQLPSDLIFYEAGGDNSVKFRIENDDNLMTIHSAESYPAFEKNQYEFSGRTQNNQTKAIKVRTRNGATRTVEVNTEMSVWTTAHRRDLSFYFFHNASGGLSLILWELENPQETLLEYTTRTNNWSLPNDWRMLSPRRQDVPPVTWVLTSIGNNEDIAIEPIFGPEGIVSGYINPNYTVEVKTVNVYGDNATSFYTGQPNQDGYFSIDADVTFGMEPSIKIFDGNGRVVYESALEVYQYRPTALEHESGYLTLERYFIDQDYMEGYTYPGAEVSFFYLDGYSSTGRPSVTADSTGYFYAEVPGHQTAKKTNIVSVRHPETGEEISVSPYPWTQEELDNAQW